MTVHISMTDQPSKARVIKANHMLQAKVGSGPLDAHKVEACQKVMDNNTVDFAPLAQDYLNQLYGTIQKARTGDIGVEQAVAEMTQPVMELKANAAIFKYHLVGNLANVMLSFLEAVKALDKTVIEIVDAHHKTLTAIVMKKMQGDGGQYGKQLEQELRDACKRYFSSKSKKTS